MGRYGTVPWLWKRHRRWSANTAKWARTAPPAPRSGPERPPTPRDPAATRLTSRHASEDPFITPVKAADHYAFCSKLRQEYEDFDDYATSLIDAPTWWIWWD
ncbi:DUF4253 domain-containing protein [Actinomadura rudentiformis]|uniref:DUF4253 domain-containing protein n=1 Tax=Actinomadura rudentiformis TaxID=359158 RepID=A0A6H9YX80_9ACTN|nr:DUF4253 domain-containing protein [Actinomadura rudentiformis]